MKEKECFLSLSPLKKYAAPKYPNYLQTHSNPDLLKKLPSRWQRNAKVLACIGLTGTLSLTGCHEFLFGNSTCSNCGFPHLGGSGGSPIYIVYLTEQEARSVMREKWESLGFDFSSAPPDYTVNVNGLLDVGIDYFNEEKNVGLSLVSRYESGWGWCYANGNKYSAETAQQEFERLDNNIDVGVMYNPKKNIGLNEPGAEERETAQKNLKAQLEGQVREFIERVQAQ